MRLSRTSSAPLNSILLSRRHGSTRGAYMIRMRKDSKQWPVTTALCRSPHTYRVFGSRKGGRSPPSIDTKKRFDCYNRGLEIEPSNSELVRAKRSSITILGIADEG